MDFVTLACPTCGSRLQVTNDLERFACSHCGNEHVVKRSGGVVALTPGAEDVQRIRIGVDRAASELAIKRLRQEIPAIETAITEKKRALPTLVSDFDFKLDIVKGPTSFRSELVTDLKIALNRANPDVRWVRYESLNVGEMRELISEYRTQLAYFRSMGKLRQRLFKPEKTENVIAALEEIISLENVLMRKTAELKEHERIVGA